MSTRDILQDAIKICNQAAVSYPNRSDGDAINKVTSHINYDGYSLVSKLIAIGMAAEVLQAHALDMHATLSDNILRESSENLTILLRQEMEENDS